MPALKCIENYCKNIIELPRYTRTRIAARVLLCVGVRVCLCRLDRLPHRFSYPREYYASSSMG